ncbi:hypothetical protein K7432_001873 [Basidiobolus ranarum]|uniref:Uncharacterized protein n=1 Tax=Basidiobolus ranarum TaxID=34480 RepID=A0ABR2W8V0_9FUNG
MRKVTSNHSYVTEVRKRRIETLKQRYLEGYPLHFLSTRTLTQPTRLNTKKSWDNKSSTTLKLETPKEKVHDCSTTDESSSDCSQSSDTPVGVKKPPHLDESLCDQPCIIESAIKKEHTPKPSSNSHNSRESFVHETIKNSNFTPVAREKLDLDHMYSNNSYAEGILEVSVEQEHMYHTPRFSWIGNNTPKTLAEISTLKESNSQGGDRVMGSPDSYYPLASTPTYSGIHLENVDETVKSIEEFLQKDVEIVADFELSPTMLTGDSHLRSLINRPMSQTDASESIPEK